MPSEFIHDLHFEFFSTGRSFFSLIKSLPSNKIRRPKPLFLRSPQKTNAFMKQNTQIIELDKGQYLSKHPKGKKLPHGIVIKEKTGIGATTVELADKTRPTILVFPNKALAATKAVSASAAYKKTVYYAGSHIPGTEDKLTELNNRIFDSLLNSDEPFKIAMVADTFLKYYQKFKNRIDNHKSLFVLFDEADVYQSDSNYRGSLEKCMRVFLQLPPSRRCLLSATFQQHSAKEFSGIDKTKIVVKNDVPDELHLFHSSTHPLSTLVYLLSKHDFRKGKLLVALNSVTACIYAAMKAEECNAKYRKENSIGILCSDSRKPYIPEKYQTELKNGILERHLTFITTSYFSGVDINSKAHVIVCSYTDDRNDHPFLTMHRIKQAMGRIRNEVKSRSLVYQTYSDFPKYDQTINERIVAYQQMVFDACDRWENNRSSFVSSEESLNKQREAIQDAFAHPNARNRGLINVVGYDTTHKKWQKYLMSTDFLIMDYEATSRLYQDRQSSIDYLIQNDFSVIEKSSAAKKEIPFDEELYQIVIDDQKAKQTREYTDVINDPAIANPKNEIRQLKFIIQKMKEYKLFNNNKEDLILYVEKSRKAKDTIHKLYPRLYLSTFCEKQFHDYFTNNKQATLLDINNAVPGILQNTYPTGISLPSLQDYSFKNQKAVQSVFVGRWVDPCSENKVYGVDESYKATYFYYRRIQKPEQMIKDFTKSVKSYLKKSKKTE